MEKLLEQRYQEATVIISTQWETITIVLLSVALLGYLAYLFWPSDKLQSDGGTTAMGTPIDYTKPQVHFSKVEKRMVLDMATEYLEGRVLFNKLSKRKKQLLYKKLGLVCGISELVPPGDVKARLKSLRKHLEQVKQPVEIPGDKPPQEVKPNDLTTQTKELARSKLASFFNTPKAA